MSIQHVACSRDAHVAIFSARLSVRPSVTLVMTPTRFKPEKDLLNHTKERAMFPVVDAKFCSVEFTSSTRTSALNRGSHVESKYLKNNSQ